MNLRERNFGVMEGMTREEIREKFKTVYDGYMSRNEVYQIPDGESLVQFNNRIITEIEKLAQNNKNKSLLIVSHGGVLDCIIRKIFELKLSVQRKFSLINTSLNTILIKGNSWILEEWGNIDHIRNSTTLDETN